MNARNAMIALGSAIMGGVIAAILLHAGAPIVAVKTDRLGGPPSETAFLPERFGVPGSVQ
ncbi:hypothetical protein J2046_004413 [Rhizobium petrolearium]|uniref:hypothetical protein n=1 Tax=Neorhizobium petrolearium TaxID=515361 RepID=UPI000FAD3D98|nr:hypothetical protein [Neorhizobium petrolearium]MBP1846139.1 hypothetical protein [Neorhizobium petrolearium]